MSNKKIGRQILIYYNNLCGTTRVSFSQLVWYLRSNNTYLVCKHGHTKEIRKYANLIPFGM